MSNEIVKFDANRLTLSQAIARYMDENAAPEWKRKSGAMIQKSPLGPIRIPQLSTKALQKWCDTRLDHVCVGTVQNDLRVIRMAYETARRTYGLSLPSNPTLDVELAEKGRKLTREELEALQAALQKAPVVQALVTVAAETGLPRGVLTAAKWRDVELDRFVLHLRDRAGGPVVRSVPLSDAAVDAMRSLPRSDPKVFSVSPERIRWAWERACRRVKLRHVRFYEARHVLEYEGVASLDTRRSLI